LTDQSFELIFDCQDSERLDKFLADHLENLTRSRIQNLIKNGQVVVDGIVAVKSGLMLKNSQIVQVHIPAAVPGSLIAEDLKLDVLFENNDLLVVNKPAGMVVHPSHGHASGTLVNAVLSHAPDLEGIGGEIRPGVIHRLDKDTSGLILIAKNERALQWFQDQFRKRKVRKEYLALGDGRPPTPSGRIETSIGRDPSQRKKMAVVPSSRGREAITEYKTLKSFAHHTLLSVHILTGRTHQIRLHLAFLGCPVAGDSIYGHRKVTIPLKRQFLHAYRLTIYFPYEKESRTFEAALPLELQQILESL